MLNLDPLRGVLKKEMTRREFLTHLGAAVIAMVGITAFLRIVSESFNPASKPSVNSTDKKGSSYGGGAYGA
ncbi:twin-arginine translocation signal domain-containing protein [Candidatus Saccharibacteria bacterium CPR2]|nr:twin-arginine translocation signal domain-containing protein [Candidatus Saccharibacteria bacterium CPR2]